MTRGWLNPTLSIGIVLLVLGLGNWVVSCTRIPEYAPRSSSTASEPSLESLADFGELTPRTNTTLLKRLNRGVAKYTFAEAKLDFYRVVQSGGRILSAIGLLLIAEAILRTWSRRRRTT